MLYLIKSSRYLKIGYTDNIASRMSHYRTHNPDFRLLATMEGDRSKETELHKKYIKYRYNNE